MPLPYFTIFPTPGSRGVNVFAQNMVSQKRKRICFSAIRLSWSCSPLSREGLVLVHHCGSKTVSSTILVPSYSSNSRASRYRVISISATCFFHSSFTLGFLCFHDYQLASVCAFFRFGDLESGTQQLLALIVTTLMMPISTFARSRSAVSASFVQFLNILLSG